MLLPCFEKFKKAGSGPVPPGRFFGAPSFQMPIRVQLGARKKSQKQKRKSAGKKRKLSSPLRAFRAEVARHLIGSTFSYKGRRYRKDDKWFVHRI